MGFLIDRLLKTVIDRDASDLHLTVGRPPVIRLHGRLRQLETRELAPEDTAALMRAITPERNQQELQEVGTTDFGFSFGTAGRFRVSVFKQRGNVAVCCRLIPYRILTFEEIGLPPIVKQLCLQPRGLVLVTGPTGCGKTTTLATMIDYINTNVDRHIITIEDPIEYYHNHKKSLVNQRELGIDVPSFAEALRRSLRQDPDVVLVGEMRDLETMMAAITAAETGHLVFATVHTTGAQGTINRIIDAFPTETQEQIRVQLSVTLVAVISQALLPTADGKGMIAAFEFMYVTPAIQNLIRENKVYRIESSIQTGKKFGMILLDDHLFQIFERGLITEQDALFKANKPSELTEKINQLKVQRAAEEAAGSR